MRQNLCLIFFIVLIELLSACSTSYPTFETGVPTSDTVFLKNTLEYYKIDSQQYPVWNKVFIETNRRSEYYNQVMDFSGMNMYMEDHAQQYQKHFDTSMLPDQWLPLHQYKGKYYLYRPGAMDDKVELRDSMVIFLELEPDYYPVNKFEQAGPRQYRVYTRGERSDGLPDLYIYVIDPVNNIAVWKYKRNYDTEYQYTLYVAKQNANKFALVVNEANEEPDEFEFDPIDFKKLLKKFRP